MRESGMQEIRFPLALIGTAIAIHIAVFVAAGGPVGGVMGLITVPETLLIAMIQAVVGVVTCFLVAQILNTGFGTLKSAFVKLVAVAMFPPAAGLLIMSVGLLITPYFPLVGGLVLAVGAISVVALFFGLLKSLFDLDLIELIVFVPILWGVSLLAERTLVWIQANA